MPKYSYVCNKCNEEFSTWHSLNEAITDCPNEPCGAQNSIVKLFSLPTVIIKDDSKVGKKVEEFIDESRASLSEFKKELEGKAK